MANMEESQLAAQVFANIDYVPPSLPDISNRISMIIMEDNDAVIKMTIKVRAPTMRHMQRTHRIDVDSFFENIHEMQGLMIKYISTKLQIADIFTKGSFSVQTWNLSCKLLQIGPTRK